MSPGLIFYFWLEYRLIELECKDCMILGIAQDFSLEASMTSNTRLLWAHGNIFQKQLTL